MRKYWIGYFFLFISLVITFKITSGSPLDDYVNAPDPHFRWTQLQMFPYSLYTIYVLNMTSQKWFDDSLSSQPIWWHHMIITVPRVLRRSELAFMLISGGSNTDPIPTSSSLTNLSVSTGSVTVELRQVPNQPIRFMADPIHESRDEDAIIAWTWKVFIESNGSDPFILLRMPMTKAAVRGMDTTQQFLAQRSIPVPSNFVIGGLSKRGWTTWTTAAVDSKRVSAAVPIVMDMLNLQKNLMHHYQSLGGWTFAFYDYYVLNITRYLTNPNLLKLADIVDPYSYINRYSNTKIFQIQAADDEFFFPDSEDFFWNDLQTATGGSHLRRIPNTGHDIQGYQMSLQSFYLSVADKKVLPSWKWNRTSNQTHGKIYAKIDFSGINPKPINVTAYHARTTFGSGRDFRKSKIDPNTGKIIVNPVFWVNHPVNVEASSENSAVYSYTAPIPPAGFWDALFIEATFPGQEATVLQLTTETLILPEKYPVPPCSGESCHGSLV